jgi:hypothetical protein
MKRVTGLLFTIFSTSIFASSLDTVEVLKIKGLSSQLSIGSRQARYLTTDDRLKDDSSILTSSKSSVKLKFADNSELVIGADSKVVLSQIDTSKTLVLNVLKGKIRVNLSNKDKADSASRIFVRTRSALIASSSGDFSVYYNSENKITSTLAFKGKISIARADESFFDQFIINTAKEYYRDDSTKLIESRTKTLPALNEADIYQKYFSSLDSRTVSEGQVSFAITETSKASIPVLISPEQFEVINKNNFLDEKVDNEIIPYTSKNIVSKDIIKLVNLSNPDLHLDLSKSEFAPKAGGFIDFKTGHYISPDRNSKLDSSKTIYRSESIGNFDEKTGQYIAPVGLILDAKAGFSVIEEKSNDPKLIVLKDDLNENIAKFILATPEEKGRVVHVISEKYVRDRINLSLSNYNSELTINDGLSSDIYKQIKAKNSLGFNFDWRVATLNRFAPSISFNYYQSRFPNKDSSGVGVASNSLYNLKFGLNYAQSDAVNLFLKIGLIQNHYFDQQTNSNPHTYNLKKLVQTQLCVGSDFDFLKYHRISLSGEVEGQFSFRKKINNFIVSNGIGYSAELFTRYRLSNHNWLSLGYKLQNQFVKIRNSITENRQQTSFASPEIRATFEF